MCVEITAGKYTPDLKIIGFQLFPMKIYKIMSRTFPNKCDNSRRKHNNNTHGSIFLLLQQQQRQYTPVVSRAGLRFCQNQIKIMSLPLTVYEPLCNPSLRLLICEMVMIVK